MVIKFDHLSNELGTCQDVLRIEKEFHDFRLILQLEHTSLYCTLLFVYHGTYTVSFPTHNITARGFILPRLFSFNHFLSGSCKFKPIINLLSTLTFTMISLVIIHGTSTFDLENGIRNFAVCVTVKKDHQTVIIKSYPVPRLNMILDIKYHLLSTFLNSQVF